MNTICFGIKFRNSPHAYRFSIRQIRNRNDFRIVQIRLQNKQCHQQVQTSFFIFQPFFFLTQFQNENSIEVSNHNYFAEWIYFKRFENQIQLLKLSQDETRLIQGRLRYTAVLLKTLFNHSKLIFQPNFLQDFIAYFNANNVQLKWTKNSLFHPKIPLFNNKIIQNS